MSHNSGLLEDIRQSYARRVPFVNRESYANGRPDIFLDIISVTSRAIAGENVNNFSKL